MFTGLIKDIGVIEKVEKRDISLLLCIATKLDIAHLEIGASIACNGCCLTIVKVEQTPFSLSEKKSLFYVDVGPETLALTCFNHLKAGDKVNLEPALRMGDPLGGHQVSGHIDNIFKIYSFEKINNEFWKLSLLFPNNYSKFIILKGSIAISGISLTIANILSFPNDMLLAEFMIIPHTYHNTILQFISANTYIEVEFDQTVKTIASLLEGMITNYSLMIR